MKVGWATHKQLNGAMFQWLCYVVVFRQGLAWPAGIPDLTKYHYKVESHFLVESAWQSVGDTDDPRAEAVLLWLANSEVHLCKDKVILYGDSDIYHVSQYSVYTVNDTWEACVNAYGVWEGEDVVIYFQLVKDGEAQCG